MKKKKIELSEYNADELQFAMIIWDDANEPGGDDPHEMNYFDDDKTRHAPHISVGIVLKDDKHGVVICRDIQIHDELTTKEICIPKAYIILKQYLK